jgi:DNA-directed RNA polymerase subunit beta
MINDNERRKLLTNALWETWGGKRLPFDVIETAQGEIIIPANRKVTKTLCRRVAAHNEHLALEIWLPRL